MSLMSHLADRASPIGQFIRQRFAGTRPLVSAANRQLHTATTIRPPASPAPYPYANIGRAIDYRIRYAFAITPHEQLVAWMGAQHIADTMLIDNVLVWPSAGGCAFLPLDDVAEARWHADGDFALELMQKAEDEQIRTRNVLCSRTLIAQFFQSLDDLLQAVQPVGRRLPTALERELGRYCWVLGLFEEAYRNHQAYVAGPLMQPRHSVAELLDLAPNGCLDDLAALFDLFYERHRDLLERPAVLNPTFAGSHDVGGADADLIVDNCLIELKASIRPVIKAEHLHQLAGYLLLDYEDALAIGSLGIYLVRQGVRFVWPVAEFVAQLTGGTGEALPALRQEFRQLCQTARAPRDARAHHLGSRGAA
jgi:hypothetical protein